MKKKEEKEVSLAKISFLKNWFFAVALVMVMAVVVVLFAVSAAPVSAYTGPMNFSFVDNTGEYPPDQIYIAIIGRQPKPWPCGNFSYVNKSGNLVECQLSDNNAPGHLTKNGENYANYFYKLSEVHNISVPKIDSARVWIGFGSPLYIKVVEITSGCPKSNISISQPSTGNPTDPNIDLYWEFVEFAIDDYGYHGNPSKVDHFSYPTTMEIISQDGSSAKFGITECRSALFDAFKNDMPAEFQNLTLQEPYRIVGPFKGYTGEVPNTPNQSEKLYTYFDPYIEEVWQYYNSTTNPTHYLNFTVGEGSFTGQVNPSDVFVFTKVGGGTCNNCEIEKPTSKKVFLCRGGLEPGPVGKQLCAAFNRHVVMSTYAGNNSADWCTTSKYYQSAPANYYAQFWHPYSIDNKAYGFSYDDICDQSPSLYNAHPKELIITLSCWEDSKFTVNLSAHWNGFSLPVNDSSVTDASPMAAKIGVNNCREVLGWDSADQKYVPYVPGCPLHNFDIRAGEGCMVNLNYSTTVVFTGKGWTSPFTIELSKNYTGIGAPVNDSSITTASSLATKIGENCKLITKWDNEKQVTVCYRPHGGHIEPPGHNCSSPLTDFDITGGDAYFVYVPNPTDVTFEGGPWHD